MNRVSRCSFASNSTALHSTFKKPPTPTTALGWPSLGSLHSTFKKLPTPTDPPLNHCRLSFYHPLQLGNSAFSNRQLSHETPIFFAKRLHL